MASIAAATLGGVAVGGAIALRFRWKAQVGEEIPARMQRVVLVKGGTDLKSAVLQVEEVETPKPKSGEVLVKIAAAPINPSDDGEWKNPRVTSAKPIGIEGSGIVVATGGGPFTGGLLGKKVAVIGGGSTFAQYAVCNAAMQVNLLPQDLPVEDGCAFVVNPWTVVGIFETVREAGGKAFIQTAAASQLGMMLVKLCKKEGVTLVNVVRRPEQKAELMKLGVDEKHIVVTSPAGSDEWQTQLKALIRELGIKHAFDAVAGDLTGTLLGMMPPGGCVWVYGRLAPEPVGNIEPLDLIYRKKQLKGFMLMNWLGKGGALKALFRSRRAAKMVREGLRTVFASDFRDVGLQDMHAEYIKLKEQGVTGTKMRVRPNGCSA